MNENDKPLKLYRDIAVSLALLTRLPLHLPKESFARGARASWAYPLVGVVMGGLAVGLSALMLSAGFDPTTVALVILSLSLILTGAMHEDGLADCADGFWGGWEKARRLEIMKDSQIGSYGVVALILALAARWWGGSALLTQGALWSLIAIATLSRAAMPVVMFALPHARNTGLSHLQGRPPIQAVGAAIALAFVIAVICLGWGALAYLFWASVATVAVACIARSKIGGQTGDVLGASQQCVEITLLLIFFG